MDSREAGTPIEVRDVTFRYRDRAALERVSIDVRPGEVVGLLGPNGSGKSTLIRCISGVGSPYEGSIRIGGYEVRELPAKRRACLVAVVPQEPTFAFRYTALEIVLMGRHPHLAGLAFESASDLERARGALDACGASEFADRSIQDLSAGERQRVVFARALAQEPRCLLLDEPASFLDVRHQVELYDRVRSIAETKRAAVLTALHDLNLAAEYCDRLVLLKRGRVVASGPTREVFTYSRLKEVFETEIYVDVNDLTGSMIAVPLPRSVRTSLERDPER